VARDPSRAERAWLRNAESRQRAWRIRCGGLSGPRFAALPPLSLYIHIPWCLRKCPYCDFNSHEARGEVPEAAYVDALITDLELALPSIWGRRITSIFIGGGTPSLFRAAAIDRLLARSARRLTVTPGAEVTLEANPGTFEREKFAAFATRRQPACRSASRASTAASLRAGSRPRCRRSARRGRSGARHLRQRQLRSDVRAAAPDVCRAMADVDAALASRAAASSFYHLTLEPNTLFHRYPPELPDDETVGRHRGAVPLAARARGYRHYETSAYARPGRECAHNLNYWQFGDYLGIGAGAHSKLSFADASSARSATSSRSSILESVALAARVAGRHEVTRSDVGFEFMLNRSCASPTACRRRCSPSARLSACARAAGLEAAEARGLLRARSDVAAADALGQRS
jgi:oxygen-independent coproporphyrinogen-3 oxidase